GGGCHRSGRIGTGVNGRRTAALCSVLALVACASGAAGAGATTAGGREGVPSFRHVAIIVLENEDFATTWGASSPATYLNSLVPKGLLATNYYRTGHVSLDNYI